MEHLCTQPDIDTAVALGSKPKTSPSTDPTGILDELLAIPAQQHNTQVLRGANIALTRSQISSGTARDAHLVHAITAIEELDKLINTAAKRVRAWYALHDPELEHTIPDHAAFIAAVLEQRERSTNTMGGNTDRADLDLLLSHAAAVSALIAHRTSLAQGVDALMRELAPNLQAVAGSMIGAKLLAIAGSLDRLAILPAGTVQLLGAETALFRHLRNRAARPPKHGVIFNHQIIQQARTADRGRVARSLASEIAIAVKVDRFKGEFIGDKLLKKVQDRADEARRLARPQATRPQPQPVERQERHSAAPRHAARGRAQHGGRAHGGAHKRGGRR